MNVERLLKLAAFLETVPDDRFDMNSFAGSAKRPWGGKDDLSCGTVACALGWATQIPEFRALGLTLGIATLARSADLVLCEEWGWVAGPSAACVFFSISHDAYRWLFCPSFVYTTRSQVIARIREYVAREGTAHADK